MSVIITGMDNQDNCRWCPFRENSFCNANGGEPIKDIDLEKEKMNWCPLKSIDGLIDKIKEAKESRPHGDIAKPRLSVAIHIIKEYCEVEE